VTHPLAKTALLVVGHGTRSKPAQREFRQVVSQVAQRLPIVAVEGCYLEMLRPDIGEGIERLASRGASQVVVVPLLLFAASHVKRDIPHAAARAAARWGLSLLLATPLGCHPQLVELSAERFRETLQPDVVAPQQIAWILVGRGSRDPLALADFYEFLAQRRRQTPVGVARAAFLAMTHPSIESAFCDVAALPHAWVVVQPHLLFSGELSNRLERMVKQQERPGARQRWLMAPPLGGDRRVAAVVVDRFRNTLRLS